MKYRIRMPDGTYYSIMFDHPVQASVEIAKILKDLNGSEDGAEALEILGALKVEPLDPHAIRVDASVMDTDGRGDGAYDLLGTWTPAEFCAELLKTLTSDWGLSNTTKPVRLEITIHKVK